MISFGNQELKDKPEIKAGDIIEHTGETVTVQATEDGQLFLRQIVRRQIVSGWDWRK